MSRHSSSSTAAVSDSTELVAQCEDELLPAAILGRKQQSAMLPYSLRACLQNGIQRTFACCQQCCLVPVPDCSQFTLCIHNPSTTVNLPCNHHVLRIFHCSLISSHMSKPQTIVFLAYLPWKISSCKTLASCSFESWCFACTAGENHSNLSWKQLFWLASSASSPWALHSIPSCWSWGKPSLCSFLHGLCHLCWSSNKTLELSKD